RDKRRKAEPPERDAEILPCARPPVLRLRPRYRWRPRGRRKRLSGNQPKMLGAPTGTPPPAPVRGVVAGKERQQSPVDAAHPGLDSSSTPARSLGMGFSAGGGGGSCGTGAKLPLPSAGFMKPIASRKLNSMLPSGRPTLPPLHGSGASNGKAGDGGREVSPRGTHVPDNVATMNQSFGKLTTTPVKQGAVPADTSRAAGEEEDRGWGRAARGRQDSNQGGCTGSDRIVIQFAAAELFHAAEFSTCQAGAGRVPLHGPVVQKEQAAHATLVSLSAPSGADGTAGSHNHHNHQLGDTASFTAPSLFDTPTRSSVSSAYWSTGKKQKNSSQQADSPTPARFACSGARGIPGETTEAQFGSLSVGCSDGADSASPPTPETPGTPSARGAFGLRVRKSDEAAFPVTPTTVRHVPGSAANVANDVFGGVFTPSAAGSSAISSTPKGRSSLRVQWAESPVRPSAAQSATRLDQPLFGHTSTLGLNSPTRKFVGDNAQVQGKTPHYNFVPSVRPPDNSSTAPMLFPSPLSAGGIAGKVPPMAISEASAALRQSEKLA
ncbi:MAG: hypothetical protein BJ554DRAFT_7805, partial [Olpidium bornovanus]